MMVDFHVRGTKENASVLDPMFHVLEEEERLRETSPAPEELVVHPGVMKLVLDEVLWTCDRMVFDQHSNTGWSIWSRTTFC